MASSPSARGLSSPKRAWPALATARLTPASASTYATPGIRSTRALVAALPVNETKHDWISASAAPASRFSAPMPSTACFFSSIDCSAALQSLALGCSHQCPLPGDAVELLLRRGDRTLGHSVHALNAVFARCHLQGLLTGRRATYLKDRRRCSIAAEAGEDSAILKHVEGFTVQGDRGTRGDIAPDQPPLPQLALEIHAICAGHLNP